MKTFYWLLICLIHFNINSQNELKIYRTKVTKSEVATTIAIGSLFGIGGMITAGIMLFKKDIDLAARIIGGGSGISISLFGSIGARIAFNELNKWHAKRNDPILIFDQEGFTYEKNMGLFKERKNVRYLWKDMIAHWEHVIRQNGRVIEQSWCYHMKDEKDIVKINVRELDIPDEIAAKVEAIRRGFITALSS